MQSQAVVRIITGCVVAPVDARNVAMATRLLHAVAPALEMVLVTKPAELSSYCVSLPDAAPRKRQALVLQKVVVIICFLLKLN